MAVEAVSIIPIFDSCYKKSLISEEIKPQTVDKSTFGLSQKRVCRQSEIRFTVKRIFWT